MSDSCPNPKCTCVDCKCGTTCRCGVTWIGPLERRVMEILWSDPEAEHSAREVADQLPEYAYTTIGTVLDRLVGKELLNRRMDGRVVKYTTAETRAVHTALLMREVLDATKDPEAALQSFVLNVPEGQIEALRTAIDQRLR